MPSIHLAAEPFHSKLFILYLLAVYGTAIVCSLKLVWSLTCFVRRRRVSWRSIVHEGNKADVLARFVLSNRISVESLADEGVDSIKASSSTDDAVFRTLRVADSWFLYLLGICNTYVAIMKRLARLTLLVSVLVVAYGACWTWADQFNDRNITGGLALLFAARLLLWRLSLGLCASAILYAISSLFELKLMRRLNSWKYLYSQIILQSSTHFSSNKCQ